MNKKSLKKELKEYLKNSKQVRKNVMLNAEKLEKDSEVYMRLQGWNLAMKDNIKAIERMLEKEKKNED